jgi:hypothetical protein
MAAAWTAAQLTKRALLYPAVVVGITPAVMVTPLSLLALCHSPYPPPQPLQSLALPVSMPFPVSLTCAPPPPFHTHTRAH